MEKLKRAPFPKELEKLTDLRTAIENYVLPDYAPPQALFARDAKLIAMGSCFAGHIQKALTEAGAACTHLMLNEGLNTPPFALVMAQRLKGVPEAALAGRVAPGTMSEEGLGGIRDILRDAAAFILTVGVSLQPFDEDGRPTFHVVRKQGFAAPHFRMLTADESLNYIRSIISTVRSMRPGIPFILTLSPVPLNQSIGHMSVIGQDCLSKSLLRVAIEMIMEEGIPDVYYWPSFEIVRWLGGHVGPFFGIEGNDHHHLPHWLIQLITQMFIERYFKPGQAA